MISGSFRLKSAAILPNMREQPFHAMTRALPVLAALATFQLAFPDIAVTEQYRDIKPGLRCHFPRKDRSFCKAFPNFSMRKGICDPTLLGHVEWCREDIVITERDDCGNFETYEAVVITYRQVYENGAWGEKFKRTYRKDPTIITPPILVQGGVK